MSASHEDLLFGNLAVKRGFITEEELNATIAYQKEIAASQGSVPSLRNILLEAWDLSAKEVEEIEEFQEIFTISNQIPGFEIYKKLGEGGMGVVYKATQTSMERTVAIKMLYPSVVDDESYIERFYREARIVGELDHQNIIHGIDVGVEQGVYYFVMEYVEGETLTEILDREGTIDEGQALHIALEAAHAMNHATNHGLIHRDIKPDNIMVTQEGVTKLCDLGLAKKTTDDDSSITQTNLAVGTPQYMAPEQVKGEELDVRADIYALGASLYKATTGDVPFDAENTKFVMMQHVSEELVSPRKKSPDLSFPFIRIIEKMMAKDPDDRYLSCEELITDLERIQEGRDPEHAELERAFSRFRRPRRRSFQNRNYDQQSSTTVPNRFNGRERFIKNRYKIWTYAFALLLYALAGYLLYVNFT